MKRLTTAFLLFATTMPVHAAPHTCRTAPTSRLRHVAVASRAAHDAAHAKLIVTAFAVPVAVPVAPFAPYWYGIADYRDLSSLRGSASQRTAPEAPPRAHNRDAAQRNADQQRSILSQKCAACHGRTSPKMGLSLVDVPALSADDRLRALRAVVTGTMPPDSEEPLNDDDRMEILRELAADE